METSILKPVEIPKRKICIIGYFGSGKSSLINRLVNDRFDESYKTSIGVTLSHKTVFCDIDKESRKLNLLIWDLEGEGQSTETSSDYYLGSSGAIIVSDLMRKETIETIPLLIEKFLNVVPKGNIILAGNKIDLCKEEQNYKALFKEIALSLNHTYFYTSAKTNENVEECFSALAKSILSS